MKKLITTLLFFSIQLITLACPVCERQQPKILRGIVHGSGPDSTWDYVIVWIIGIIALATLIFSVRWIIKPGEKNKDHIKYFILNKE